MQKKSYRNGLYILGLGIGIVGLILFPILYIGCLISIGYLFTTLILNHINLSQFQSWIIYSLYELLLIESLLLLFFWIRILSATKTITWQYELVRENEPRFFSFVDQVCHLMHVPRVSRIYVNMEINAGLVLTSALQRRVELTIGLPLIAGINAQQLAGVIAHELGHYKQMSGMRISYFFAWVYRNLSQAKNTKAEWEQWMMQRAHKANLFTRIFLGYCQIHLWSAGKILQGWICLCNLCSGFLHRQMEFDADKNQAEIAGKQAFESVILELRVLDEAMTLALRSLQHSLSEGKWAANLPSLILSNCRPFISSVRRRIRQDFFKKSSSLDDMHPTDGDRINNIQGMNEAGKYQWGGMAQSFFVAFMPLCEDLTKAYYSHEFNVKSGSGNFLPAEEIMAEYALIRESEAALEGFFLGLYTDLLPILLPQKNSKTDFEMNQSLLKLSCIREQMQSFFREWILAFEKFHRLELQRRQALQQIAAAKRAFQRPVKPDLEEAQAIYAGRLSELEINRQTLAEFEKLFNQRIILSLQCLPSTLVHEHLLDATELGQELTLLLPCLHTLSNNLQDVHTLRDELQMLFVFTQIIPGEDLVRAWQSQVTDITRSIHAHLLSLKNQFQSLAHPFALDLSLSIGDYAFEHLPDISDSESLLDVGERVYQRLIGLYDRAMGRVVFIAGRVEGALGFGPIELPADLWVFNGENVTNLDIMTTK